ncbi:MAG: hypothetical protein Crog4KO_18520 [Crocinitomicaceae bacterium]
MTTKLKGHTNFALLLTLFVSAMLSCDSREEEKKENSVNYSQADLQGDWKIVDKRYIEDKQSRKRYVKNAQPDLPQEWTAPVFLDDNGVLRPVFQKEYLSLENKHLRILNDSIFSVNYPVQLNSRNNFTLRGNSLLIGKNRLTNSIELNKTKDTLRLSYLDYYGLYIEESYRKTSFDDKVFKILCEHETNFPELAGTWHIIRRDGFGYGEVYELEFPFEIPDSIVLSEQDLQAALYSDKSIQMSTDGQNRKYFMRYNYTYNEHLFDNELLLIPGAWFDLEAWTSTHFTDEVFIRFEKK